MSLIKQSIEEFVQAIDAKTPTPGGGSASALISIIGLALARMVGHHTIDKKTFLALPKETQDAFNEALSALLDIKARLMPLVDKDAQSFDKVMTAYRLPKESTKEQEIRQSAIQEATLGATLVPLEIANLSLSAFPYLDIILKYGNVSAITDVGVSVLALYTGIEGALLNVLINLGGLSDSSLANNYKTEIERIKKESISLKDAYLAKVYAKLK